MIYKVYRSSPPQVFLEKVVLKKRQQIYKKTHMPKCDFNNIALQLLLELHFGMGVLL